MKESDPRPTLQIIGRIRSSLTNRETAPKQEFEGGVEARIEIFQEFQPAMEGLAPGKEILLLTWMHLAGRE
jgi:tRNA (Thr-GGU) A37 N-methylase